MFDLEKEIERWRGEMAATGVAPEVLLELEEHLREDLDRRARLAITGDIFRAALQQMGNPAALGNEFALIATPSLGQTLRWHKWKLVGCVGVSLLAALVLRMVSPTPYVSEARLLVRSAMFAPPGADPSSSAPVRFPLDTATAQRLAAVMQQEAEILSSLDLARKVARSIGPDRILKRVGGGNDIRVATTAIWERLRVSAPAGSPVLHLTFQHPDPHLVQAVLREVINQYLKTHVETRGAVVGPPVVEKVSSIKPIQNPTAAFADVRSLSRMQSVLVLGGIFLGCAWILILRLNEKRGSLERCTKA
jgi:hypothetical protein